MEVERVQDGPLKKSEITRFLEASKTSYKAVDNILTDKREPLFQQRTLIDIASEAELRKSATKQQLEIEEIEQVDQSQIMSDQEDLDAAAQKVEEQKESERVHEEKKVEDQRLAQELKEKENYEKGFAEGKIEAELEAKEKLEKALISLENARKSMLDLNASHFINLRDRIATQILNLSSERAGMEIKALPEKFLSKIETLLETIGQTTKEPIVFLNSSDLEAVQETIAAKNDDLGVSFKSDKSLLSGDIIIEIGSIAVRDTAKERSGIMIDSELVKSTDTKNSLIDDSSKTPSGAPKPEPEQEI